MIRNNTQMVYFGSQNGPATLRDAPENPAFILRNKCRVAVAQFIHNGYFMHKKISKTAENRAKIDSKIDLKSLKNKCKYLFIPGLNFEKPVLANEREAR